MRRAVVAFVSTALIAGCGLVAGLDEQFGYPAVREGGAPTGDATIPHDDAAAPDASSDVDDASTAPVDVVIPTDVFTPDANEPPPDAAEAGCSNPTACDDGANKCCAPGVCNAANHCVGACVEGIGCGNESACCYGKHCGENFSCVSGCGQNRAFCNSPAAPCCLGFVCPPGVPAFCQACGQPNHDCRQGWECCSKTCMGGKCR